MSYPALLLVLALGCGQTPPDGGDASVLADADVPPDASLDTAAPPETRPFDPRDPVIDLSTIDPAEMTPPTLDEALPGDLLLSRIGHGCLSVVDDALASGAPLDVVACRGTPGQRWIAGGDGTLSPADAPSLCLAADGSTLVLAPCAGIETPFRLTAEGVIDDGTRAADVGWNSARLIAYRTHREDNQRWRWLADDLSFLAEHRAPIAYPLAVDDVVGFAVEQARHRVATVQPPYPLLATPDVSLFPGEVATGAPLRSRRVRFDRRFDHDTDYLHTGPIAEHWQSTGLYARAGEPIVVRVPEDADATGLFIRINQHTDVLRPTSGNVASSRRFDRLPHVALRLPLTAGESWFRSPYGGTIVLESTEDTGETIDVDIHGAIESPRFVLGVTEDEEWRERRALGAPWAEIEGDRAVIVVPSEQIRALDRPELVAERYDRMVGLEADLFGLDPEAAEGVHRMYDGKSRFVTDPQPRAGYGHAGFPIVVYPEWNLARERDYGNDWGVWHELGHNHQQFCLWSRRFHSEATVNIFSLYVEEAVTDERHRAGLDVLTVGRLMAGRVDFESGDVWDKLVFLMQPVWAFPELGWDVYRALHRAYRELPAEDVDAICDSEDLQLDRYYRLLSEVTGHDLRAHFETWGLSPSAEAQAEVEALGLPEPAFAVSEVTRY